MAGREINETLKAMNCMAMVAPRPVPSSTPNAWYIEMSPALTKPTTRMEAALLDCSTEARPLPIKAAVSRLPVSFSRNRRSLSPASLCNPSDIDFMPSMKSPSPPSTSQTKIRGM